MWQRNNRVFAIRWETCLQLCCFASRICNIVVSALTRPTESIRRKRQWNLWRRKTHSERLDWNIHSTQKVAHTYSLPARVFFLHFIRSVRRVGKKMDSTRDRGQCKKKDHRTAADRWNLSTTMGWGVWGNFAIFLIRWPSSFIVKWLYTFFCAPKNLLILCFVYNARHRQSSVHWRYSPVRPLPALQWIAATFFSSSESHFCTSLQNDCISSMLGGLWS